MCDLTYISTDDIEVGDVVGFVKPIQCSWGVYYKYPNIVACHVDRITPKRTKYVLGGITFTKKSYIGALLY